MKLKGLWKIPYVLVAFGAINWGVTVFNVNLVSIIDAVFGNAGMIASFIYVVIGLSGIIVMLDLFGYVKSK